MLPNFNLDEQDGQDMRIIINALAGHGVIGMSARRHHEMDLAAVHNHCCPLDLAKMRDIVETGPTHPQWVDVVHDVDGIDQHLDRSSFKLKDHFSPRLARPAPAKRPVDYTPRLDKQRRG